MKVSVITVAYNSAGTIGDTARSVAEQSHPDVEHLVVDGASRDGTLDVVRRLAPHARCVSEPDRGIYDAMNKGLRLATGEVIGFLNADDMYAHRDVVSNIAAAFGSDPSVDAVFGDLVYVNGEDPRRVVRRWRSGSFARSRLRFGWMPAHPTLYVRAARVAAIGPFDCAFKVAADYDWMLRLLKAGDVKAAYLPEILVRMRTGGASNGSVRAILRKSREDLLALRRNHVGGVVSLACKNLRKIPQFSWSRAH